MSHVCGSCGESLPGDVRKCLKCQSYQGNTCENCGIPLPPKANRCNSCDTYQSAGHCDNCGASMRSKARRCTKCLAFTGWRGWIPRGEIVLALILSIISLLAAVVPPVVRWWNDRSLTEVRVLGVEEHEFMDAEGHLTKIPMIRLGVTNVGTRPSFVRAATISFTEELGLGKEPLALEFAEVRERFVRPDETSYLHVSSASFAKKKFAVGVLKKSHVTVTLHVEETLRNARKLEERPDTVVATDIEGWISDGS